MIRRLRVKFICINMAIVTIMLCVIFGLVFHFTSVNLEERSAGMLQAVALEPVETGPPGMGGQVRLPYFSIRITVDGDLVPSGNGYYDLTDVELLRTLIELSAGQRSGVLSDYALRYLRVVTPTDQRVVFADISSEVSALQSLRENCLAIGAVSFLVFLAISVLLAGWAVRPVERAWEQQRQFVADASHELKTPLTVILSSAQLLAQEGEDPLLRSRLTGNILAVSEQMRDLTGKLLDAARVDEGADERAFSSLDLSTLVSEALLPFDPVFYERGMTLESGIDAHIRVRGSAERLTEVVNILLDNAQKYGASPGAARVTLRRGSRRTCLLSVSSRGKELSPRERRDIFKRFYRGDGARTREGSYGLGLSIAQGIVRSHRGRIWAESGGGVNTFFVQLPAIPAQQPAEPGDVPSGGEKAVR